MQYIIRRNEQHYEIAKFNDSSTPVSVYTIKYGKCDCPAWGYSCKHTRILNQWVKAGSPVGRVYDDEANVIGSLFTADFNTKEFSRFSIQESIRMSN